MEHDNDPSHDTEAPTAPIVAVDLFCGAGGLTLGLRKAGIRVVAGIDIDRHVEYAYSWNNPGARFLRWDVASKYVPSIAKLFGDSDRVRLLAGCAPCQPFSKLTNGRDGHESWDLLDNFSRFVAGIRPELVSMENVPELQERGRDVFERFLDMLARCGYWFDHRLVRCHHYGVPQSRTRLVLLASLLGPIVVPEGRYRYRSQWRTVRDAIGGLRPIRDGEQDPDDHLHVASKLSPTNLRRIRMTPHDGGTWKQWPRDLVLDCHRRDTGRSYGSIYGRMRWDRPGPTMTTLCNGLGNGRFGHPEQNRAITLREAALIQSFPRRYELWPREGKLNRRAVGRMIGNAVPPKLAKAIGEALVDHVGAYV